MYRPARVINSRLYMQKMLPCITAAVDPTPTTNKKRKRHQTPAKQATLIDTPLYQEIEPEPTEPRTTIPPLAFDSPYCRVVGPTPALSLPDVPLPKRRRIWPGHHPHHAARLIVHLWSAMSDAYDVLEDLYIGAGNDVILFGRGRDSDVLLVQESAHISRIHCTLQRDPIANTWSLTNHAINGTRVNDRLYGAHMNEPLTLPIYDGDIVGIVYYAVYINLLPSEP